MELPQVTDPRSPAYTPGVRRLPNIKPLTSIRFFAALYVTVYHLVRPFSLWGRLEPAASAGYIGVSFFFLLSGFILTYSHANEYEAGRSNPPKFWIARLARIYPVYLASMLFAAYVNRYQFHNKVHLLAYAADLLLVQSWSIRMAPFFNVPAWSLSCEAFFYLVFPFLLLRLRPSSAKRCLGAMAVWWMLALAAPLICVKLFPAAAWSEHASAVRAGGEWVYRVRRLPILALPQFLAGISLGWFYLRYRPSARTASLLVWTGLAALFAILFWADKFPLVMLHNGLLIPLFSMIILGLGEPSFLSRILSNSVLVLLGEASFALYLIHFLFNDFSKQDFGANDSFAALGWKLAIVIPVSVLLHLFVERPGRKVILGWWSRRHPAQLKMSNS